MSFNAQCLETKTPRPAQCDNPLITYAIEQIVNKAIPVVAAAGNDGLNACWSSPASEPLVFTVGATDYKDMKLPQSNDGSCLTMFAPGGWVQTTSIHHQYGKRYGTSMASALVAGVFAGLLSTYSYPNTEALYKQVIDWSTKNFVTDIPNDMTPNRLITLRSISKMGTTNSALERVHRVSRLVTLRLRLMKQQ